LIFNAKGEISILNQGRKFIQLWKNMGSRYILYRLRYEVERRLGLVVKRFPTSLDSADKLGSSKGLDEIPFYFEKDRLNLRRNFNYSSGKVERLLRGELNFFNASWVNLGRDYDWVSHPITGCQFPMVHWSKISDLDPEMGDIKYVWEKSRFSWALEFIRFDYHNQSDHSAYLFNQLDSWIESNPLNIGPNYRCSQEMSLRLWNWSFIFHFYKESKAFTEDRWRKYQKVIYGHLHHIYHHIDFSRIAVRNNHAITETAILFLSRWLFPFIPEVQQWSKEGERYFIQEIEYQIYEDGTFLQFSMNYHRVVIQLLSSVISLTKLNNYQLPKTVLDRAYRSVDFLYQCMGNKETGQLPLYGQNDGAWFFPWSDSDYRDFRPMINSLHAILTGQHLFDDPQLHEEWHWWGQVSLNEYEPLEEKSGLISYPIGGYYLIKDDVSYIFFRNGNHNDRPAQADNQHIDLWYQGNNLLTDSGTYSYNTDQQWIKYFMGSEGHNVIQIGEHDQMLKGERFIWYYWTQSLGVEINETSDFYEIIGEISAYRHLNRNITLKRRIRKYKGKEKIEIFDQVSNYHGNELIKQHWHLLNSKRVQFESEKEVQSDVGKAHFSKYYGIKETNQKVTLSTQMHELKTMISYA
jgi:hypothetical protein